MEYGGLRASAAQDVHRRLSGVNVHLFMESWHLACDQALVELDLAPLRECVESWEEVAGRVT